MNRKGGGNDGNNRNSKKNNRGPKGHRQKGAGTVAVSKGEQMRNGVMCKEWQRTPTQLIHDFCQAKKRQKPLYHRVKSPTDTFRMRCVLPDGKNKAKDLGFSSEQNFQTMDEAKHAAALLALYHLEPTRPHERKLPDHYREMWLLLVSNGQQTKTAQASKDSKNDEKKTSKDTTSTKTTSSKNEIDLWGSAGDFHEDGEKRGSSLKKEKVVALSSDRKFSSVSESNKAYQEKQAIRNKKNRGYENRLRANPNKQVFMSLKCREMVESILAKIDGSASVESSATIILNEEDYRITESSIISLGFSKKNTQLALSAMKNNAIETRSKLLSDSLDWLCLNLKEGDLPKSFNPEGTQLDVIVNSKERKESQNFSDIERKLLQHAMKRGFSRSDCLKALENVKKRNSKQDELEENVMIELYRKLMVHFNYPISSNPIDFISIDDSTLLQEDEVMALDAIYSESFSCRTSENGNWLKVILPSDMGIKGAVTLEVLVGPAYPHEAPIAQFIHSENSEYHSHILFLVHELAKECTKRIGEPMIYEICDWLQSHLEDFVTEKKEQVTLYVDRKLPESSPRTPPPAPTSLIDKTGSKRHSSTKISVNGQLSKKEISALNDSLYEGYHKMQIDPDLQNMRQSRAKLPAAKEVQNLVKLVASNQVVLVCGKTGCGKTTQVPQYILDDWSERKRGGECNIICTQPRRLAAIGVATRVAQERNEKLGNTVGYTIRMQNLSSKNTRLLFCTTGILLRRLLTDTTLKQVTHVIVDEVHERNVDTDFLLSILRDILPRRPSLRIILMSATMNSDLFVKYFKQPNFPMPPILDIPGFTYPVNIFNLEEILANKIDYTIPHTMRKKCTNKESSDSLECTLDDTKIDYNLLVTVVESILTKNSHMGGAILIFLPGVFEIMKACQLLTQRCSKQHSCWILPLHGGLPASEQSLVFRTSTNKTKIVASTNIAETSLTIEDITVVIDTGKMKELSYDALNVRSSLKDTWVSHASAQQRSGRAGRVRSGDCYRLYTLGRQKHFQKQQTPEIHRVALEQLCLQILLMKGDETNIYAFLAKAIEPPSTECISAAVRLLVEIGALTETSTQNIYGLTSLGRHLARLPVDARVGKMLIFGAMLRCLNPVLTIAAAMSNRSPFLNDYDKSKYSTTSDHLQLIRVYEEFRQTKQKRDFCRQQHVSYDALDSIGKLRQQYFDQLEQIGFVNKKVPGNSNENEENPRMIKAALCAGLYGNLINVQFPEQKYYDSAHGAFAGENEAKKLKFYIHKPETTPNEYEGSTQLYSTNSNSLRRERVFLHPGSFNFYNNSYNSPWLLYNEVVETSKLFVRESTMVSPYPILLFGGNLEVQHDKNILCVDSWIKFNAVARIGVLIKTIRHQLDRLLQQKIENPKLDITKSKLIDAICYLIMSEGM